MRRWLVTTASIIALGLGGIGFASATGTNIKQSAAPSGSTEATAPAKDQSQASTAMPSKKVTTKVSVKRTGIKMNRTEIRQAQLRLRQDHLYRGPINGKWGSSTKIALQKFEKRSKLPVTAKLDRRTTTELLGGTVGQGSSTAPRRLHRHAMTTKLSAKRQKNATPAENNMGQGTSMQPTTPSPATQKQPSQQGSNLGTTQPQNGNPNQNNQVPGTNPTNNKTQKY